MHKGLGLAALLQTVDVVDHQAELADVFAVEFEGEADFVGAVALFAVDRAGELFDLACR